MINKIGLGIWLSIKSSRLSTAIISFIDLLNKVTLSPTAGNSSLFTSGSSLVLDSNNEYQEVDDNVPMFEGARLVHNHCKFSDDLTVQSGTYRWYESGGGNAVDFETLDLPANGRIYYLSTGNHQSDRLMVRAYMEYVSGNSSNVMALQFQQNVSPFATIASTVISVSDMTPGSVFFTVQVPGAVDISSGVRCVFRASTGNSDAFRFKLKNIQIEFITSFVSIPNQIPSEFLGTNIGVSPENIPDISFNNWETSHVPDEWNQSGTHNANNYVEDAGSNGIRLVSDGTGVGIRIANDLWLHHNEEYYIEIVAVVVSGSVKLLNSVSSTILVISSGGTIFQKMVWDNGGSSGFVLYNNAVACDVSLTLSVKSMARGANIEGIKYFDTELDNTASGAELTDVVGSTLVTTLVGQNYEPASTNIFLNSRDPEAEGLTLSSATISKKSLTVTTASGSAWRNYTVTALTDYVFSFVANLDTYNNTPKLAIYDVTNASFIAVDIAFTGDGLRVIQEFSTPTGCILARLYIYRNGLGTGIINYDHIQLEERIDATSPIITTGSAVTRIATDHDLAWPSGIINDLAISAEVTFQSNYSEPSTVGIAIGFNGNSDYLGIVHNGTSFFARKRIGGTFYQTSMATAIVAGQSYGVKAVFSSDIGITLEVDGASVTTSTNTTDVALPATFRIGRIGTDSTRINAVIKNVKVNPL